MSFEAAAWAIKQRTKTATDKLVLIVLADCHNRESGACFPSYKYIAEHAQCSERQVGRSIQNLEESGLITAEKKAGKSHNYQLIITTPDNLSPPTIETRPPTFEAEPPTLCPTTPDTMSYEPVSNQEKKPRNITKKDLVEMGVDEQVATDWLQVRKQKKAPLTFTAMKTIIREAEKACLPIDRVIEICAERSWQGFKAEWIKKDFGNSLVTHEQDFITVNTNTSWAEGL